MTKAVALVLTSSSDELRHSQLFGVLSRLCPAAFRVISTPNQLGQFVWAFFSSSADVDAMRHFRALGVNVMVFSDQPLREEIEGVEFLPATKYMKDEVLIRNIKFVLDDV